MLKYIIKLFLLLISIGTFAQELPKRKVYIRPGVDLSRFVLPLIGDIKVSGYEFSVDGEIKYNFFPIFEFGANTIDNKTQTYNYRAEGNYWRIGMNYNMLKYQHRLDRNIFYIGFRYAQGSFWQQATDVTFENTWGQYSTDIPKNDLNIQWAEAVIGLKGELFKNFFVGYTIRVKRKIKSTDYESITPYFIPGYGDGSEDIHTGMSFTASYAIPIIRLTSKHKAKK